MATNSERPTPFDLRATIPLAKETLVNLARQPKRTWLIPILTLFTGITFATLMLELMFAPGPITALAFEGELRSNLSANYRADPLGAKIHELRLTIMDEVLSGGGGDSQSGPASGDPKLSDPVPTATMVVQAQPTATDPPATTAAPSPTDTPLVVPTATTTGTLPPTASPTAPPAANCDLLSIDNLRIDGDDKLKATIRNDSPLKAFLTDTTVEWPDVPPPAYVDYFEFSGDRYYTGDDHSSPTSKGGTSRQIPPDSTRNWMADWDDEPNEGLYGSFTLTLSVKISGDSCKLSASTFKAPPATPVPSTAPSETPPPPTETEPGPTVTTMMAQTSEPTATATAPTPTPTP